MRILLVEDNPGDVFLLQRGFQMADPRLDLRVETTAESALAGLKGAVNPPSDIILVDINLPGMTGHDLILHLKAEVWISEVPIFVFTSSRAEKDVKRSFALQADGHIIKPDDLAGATRLGKFLSHCWFDGQALPFLPGEVFIL